jgi:hypothetical protein
MPILIGSPATAVVDPAVVVPVVAGGAVVADVVGGAAVVVVALVHAAATRANTGINARNLAFGRTFLICPPHRLAARCPSDPAGAGQR